MATLNDTERKQIVQRLATYKTPTEVARWASEAFGKRIGRQQVAHYDPTRSEKTGQQWVELFYETRKTFNKDASRVAIAQKLWRLRELQNIATDPGTEPSDRLKAMEQAAKEMGEAYTNKRLLEHSGEGGTPLQIVFTNDVPEPDE
jgi:hypothetical protein